MGSERKAPRIIATAITVVAIVVSMTFTDAIAENISGYTVQPSSIVPRWSGATPGEWTMDYEAALTKAESEDRFSLMLFTGMWWCPHCQVLEGQVLGTEVFKDYVASNGFYLVAMDFPYRDGYSNNCWLWNDEYRRDYCGGMTAEEGTNTVYRRYQVQDAYSVPGAARQQIPVYDGKGSVVETIDYGRVGYPTMLVIKPNGQVAGRFAVSKTFASCDYVLKRIDHLLQADEWDESDDYWQHATVLKEPLCEDDPVIQGHHTLGLTDKTDWYRLDLTAGGGYLWNFSVAAEAAVTEVLELSLYAEPTGSPMVSQSITLKEGGALSLVLPKTGTYYLKVSTVGTPDVVVPYTLSYEYTVAPAVVKFRAAMASVNSTSAVVSLQVEISNADPGAEIEVDWYTEDGVATNGIDFVTEGGTLVWTSGERKVTKTISIPLSPVKSWKGDRNFSVHLVPRRHCTASSAVSSCTVLIKEMQRRSPGKLLFEDPFKTTSSLLREGDSMEVRVNRIGGSDGVVTGTVVVAEGRIPVSTNTLVWAHGESGSKSFIYRLEPQTGVQDPIDGTMTLQIGGGAVRGTPNLLKFTRLDKWMSATFADYNRTALASTASVIGDGWFFGTSAERADPVLRSKPLTAVGSELSVKFMGPGVLLLDLGGEGDAATRLSIDAKVLEPSITAPGRYTLAIPSGTKTLRMASVRQGEVESFVTADWQWIPFSALKLEPKLPYLKTAVGADRALRLTAVAADPGLWPEADDVGLSYEIYGGIASAKMSRLPFGEGGADVSVPGTVTCGNVDFPALRSALETAIGRTFYWRMDLVHEDRYGNRAEQKGAVGNFQVVAAAAPAIDLKAEMPAGSLVDAEVATVVLPELTAGVRSRIGPLPLGNIPTEAKVVGTVKNGYLPAGLKLEIDASGVWLQGVPQKAGEYAFDFLPSARIKEHGKTTTTGGSSVRIQCTVLPLGDVVASYGGYRVEGAKTDSPTARAGSASMTVTDKGVISGKLVLDGTNVSFKASSFTALTGGALHLSDVMVKVGREELPLTMELDLGTRDGKPRDVFLKAGDAEYWLYRNNWNTVEGKLQLQEVVGDYTAALPIRSSFPAGAPSGAGYLSVTVKNSGTAVYSGVDSLGKSFSGTAPVWRVPDSCNLAGYSWKFHLSAKPSGSSQVGSGLFGLVQISPDEINPDIRYLISGGEPSLRLVNLNPKASSLGTAWTNVMEIVGGTYDASKGPVPAGEWRLVTALDLPLDYDGTMGTSGSLLHSVPRAVTLRSDGGAAAAFDADEWGSKLSTLTTRTGSYRMQFVLTYANAMSKRKVRQVTVKGLLIQNSATGKSFWSGWFGLPDKAASVDSFGRSTVFPTISTYPFVLE